MKQAIVSAKIRQNESTIVTHKMAMSTDLPADKLGELIAGAIKEAWEQGLDPTHYHVVIHFK